MSDNKNIIPIALHTLHQRLNDGDLRMGRIELSMTEAMLRLEENTRLTIENTELTQRNAETTQDIKDLIVAARLGFKVLGGLGAIVKWLGVISAGALAIYSALYAATHGGVPPK